MFIYICVCVCVYLRACLCVCACVCVQSNSPLLVPLHFFALSVQHFKKIYAIIYYYFVSNLSSLWINLVHLIHLFQKVFHIKRLNFMGTNNGEQDCIW